MTDRHTHKHRVSAAPPPLQQTYRAENRVLKVKSRVVKWIPGKSEGKLARSPQYSVAESVGDGRDLSCQESSPWTGQYDMEAQNLRTMPGPDNHQLAELY